MAREAPAEPWLLFIHEIPARPPYLRARVRKRLARLGAVAVKRSVYAVPASSASIERLTALAADVRESGGNAVVVAARFLDAADERALRRAERAERRTALPAATGMAAWHGRRWATRRGVHVDRIACAWLIRGWLDPAARIRLVGPGDPPLASEELGFDMPGGRFTHAGGGCSFESLLAASGLAEPALTRMAEIVHDLDLKDGRFGHPETAGVGRLLDDLVQRHVEDRARLAHGRTFFDALYRSLAPAEQSRRPLPPGGAERLKRLRPPR